MFPGNKSKQVKIVNNIKLSLLQPYKMVFHNDLSIHHQHVTVKNLQIQTVIIKGNCLQIAVYFSGLDKVLFIFVHMIIFVTCKTHEHKKDNLYMTSVKMFYKEKNERRKNSECYFSDPCYIFSQFCMIS